MRMKYIQHGALGFVLWPDHGSANDARGMDHRDMAEAVRFHCHDRSCKVISAGFVWLYVDNGGRLATSVAEQRSESLQLGPMVTDALNIQKQLAR